MDGELAFRLLNAVVMPWWIIWLVAPRSSWARGLASHGGVFVALAVVYAAFLVAGFSLAGEGGGFDFEGLRGALSAPLGFLAPTIDQQNPQSAQGEGAAHRPMRIVQILPRLHPLSQDVEPEE